MNDIATIINDWVALDRRNIVNRSAEMYWVAGPLEYTTGQRLDRNGGIAFYWHVDNIPGATRNLGRSAIALTLILREQLPPAERAKPEWIAREAALHEILRTHWFLLSDGDRNLLLARGLDFSK